MTAAKIKLVLAVAGAACLLLVSRAEAAAPLLPEAPPARCHAPYGTYAKRLESVCFDVLAAGAGVEVRDFTRSANVSVVSNVLDSVFGSFGSALFAFGAIAEYFTGDNLELRNISYARTNPLIVLPNRTSDPSWVVAMAIAPSRFPDPLKVPAPASGAVVTVHPLSVDLSAPLASRHEQLPAPATQADFEQCAADLVAALPNVDGGRFKYDPLGYWSPTFAFYYGNLEQKTFDIECWVQVKQA